jgi:hypothetical protein
MFVDGIVEAIDRQRHTVTVSPEQEDDEDDLGETTYGPPISIVVPRASDFARFSVGQQVGLVVRKLPSGRLVFEDSTDGDASHDPQNTSSEDDPPDPSGVLSPA